MDIPKEEQQYHAPSWSWASCHGTVDFDTDRESWGDEYVNYDAELGHYWF